MKTKNATPVSVKAVQSTLDSCSGQYHHDVVDLLNTRHPGWQKNVHVLMPQDCSKYRAMGIKTAKNYGYID